MYRLYLGTLQSHDAHVCDDVEYLGVLLLVSHQAHFGNFAAGWWADVGTNDTTAN
jgi:hypothetical protein